MDSLTSDNEPTQKTDSDFEELNFFNILNQKVLKNSHETQESDSPSQYEPSSNSESDTWSLSTKKKRRRTSQGKSPEAKRKISNNPNSWMLDLYNIPTKFLQSEKSIREEINRCKETSHNYKININQDNKSITIKFTNQRDFLKCKKPWPFDAFNGKLSLTKNQNNNSNKTFNKLCINKISLETKSEEVDQLLNEKGIHHKNLSRFKNNRGYETTLFTFDSETVLLNDLHISTNTKTLNIRLENSKKTKLQSTAVQTANN